MTYHFITHNPTTQIYALSLHDALPISDGPGNRDRCKKELRRVPFSYAPSVAALQCVVPQVLSNGDSPMKSERKLDRKSTRLNSSNRCISYAVFCLKKKKKKKTNIHTTK